MNLVIMAAGMGSRFGGLKQVEPVGPSGEFILDYSIYDAIKNGVDKVIFVIKEENLDLFKETVGNRIAEKVKVEYVFQKITDVPEDVNIPETRTKPWGTGQAILCCKDAVDSNFIVINADDFYGYDAFKTIAEFLKTAKDTSYAMVGFNVKNTITENGTVSRGICSTDEHGYLKTINERTVYGKDGNIVIIDDEGNEQVIDNDTPTSMNVWGFTPVIFDALEKGFKEFFEKNKKELDKKEFYIPTVIQDGIKTGSCTVNVLPTVSKWHGITYKEDKAELVQSIKSLIDMGEYPENLWA